MNNIETMKLALEALEYLDVTAENYVDDRIPYAAITALRQAIEQAQQAEPVVGVFDYKEHAEGLQRDYDLLLAEYNDLKAKQAEPVAWMDDEMNCIFFDAERPEPFDFDFWKPLYTTPPPRQPLTDEEILKVWEQAIVQDNGAHARLDNQPFVHFARAIEAAVWEKQK